MPISDSASEVSARFAVLISSKCIGSVNLLVAELCREQESFQAIGAGHDRWRWRRALKRSNAAAEDGHHTPGLPLGVPQEESECGVSFRLTDTGTSEYSIAQLRVSSGKQLGSPMSILRELNDAISKGTPESRLTALWHATDMLIMGRYTESEIWIFGEVIGHLSEEIELAARSQLARRLARSDNAPIYMINKLASDDSIDVAGPVLRYSERLGNQVLVANARCKSQQHLFAISRRKSIDEPVTDVLVTRGDQTVVNSVAVNTGARFSDSGFLQLIKRSENDSILAEHLGRRRDIPRHLFQQLIAKASDEVRKKLQIERPEAGNAVADVAGLLHAMFGPASKSYFSAKKTVGMQHQRGDLGEAQLLEYAQARKLNEAIVALSLLCALPVDVVERAMLAPDKEAMLILAKALDLSWATAMALLFLGAPDYRIATKDLDAMKAEFARLDIETSKNVLQAYHSRKEAAGSNLSLRPQLHAV